MEWILRSLESKGAEVPIVPIVDGLIVLLSDNPGSILESRGKIKLLAAPTPNRRHRQQLVAHFGTPSQISEEKIRNLPSCWLWTVPHAHSLPATAGQHGWLRSNAFIGSLLSVPGEDHEQLASCLRIPWRVLCVRYSQLRKYFHTSPDLLDSQNLVGPSLGSTSWHPPSPEKQIFLQTLFSLLRHRAQDFAPQPLYHLSLVPGFPLSYCHSGHLECSKSSCLFFLLYHQTLLSN